MAHLLWNRKRNAPLNLSYKGRFKQMASVLDPDAYNSVANWQMVSSSFN